MRTPKRYSKTDGKKVIWNHSLNRLNCVRIINLRESLSPNSQFAFMISNLYTFIISGNCTPFPHHYTQISFIKHQISNTYFAIYFAFVPSVKNCGLTVKSDKKKQFPAELM